MEMISSSSSSASDDYDEPLLKKLCVLLCMPQNAPECTSEHLTYLVEHPTRPPRVKDWWVAIFSTSASNFAPQIKIWPWLMWSLALTHAWDETIILLTPTTTTARVLDHWHHISWTIITNAWGIYVAVHPLSCVIFIPGKHELFQYRNCIKIDYNKVYIVLKYQAISYKLTWSRTHARQPNSLTRTYFLCGRTISLISTSAL